MRRKMIVFPLMFLAFAGCMYLIFSPSGKEDVNVESVGASTPTYLPAEDRIIATSKRHTSRDRMLNRKQQDKIQSLQDFGFTLDDKRKNRKRKSTLMPEEMRSPKRGGWGFLIRQTLTGTSTAVKHVLRNALCVDEEKEDLKRQVAELTDRLQQQQNATPTADDQMALLEKSYELAAKYIDGQDGQRGRLPTNTDSRQNGWRYRHSRLSR